MLIYILKFSGCLFILILFYRLFLEKESFHNLKRFYLLGILLLSSIIPSISFIDYIEVPKVITSLTEISETQNPNSILKKNTEKTLWKDHIPTALWTIYTIGFLVFSFRFGKHLYEISFRIKNNLKLKDKTFTNVLLLESINPHAFFNYIFLNKHKYENNAIPKEIILHEQTHARELHALDIIFIEIIQIIFWFNPLMYLIKKDMKLNHEFLADQSVLKLGIEPTNYQQLLLAFSSNASEPQLANAINYSSIKKRLTVMKTQTTKSKTRIKSLLFMPLLAILIYGFSNRKLVEKGFEPQVSVENPLSSNTKFSPNKHSARSIEIRILDNDNYIVDDMKATKNTLANVVNTLHNDITPDVRNNIMNIHITSSKAVSKTNIWFIYNALLDYGFYRMIHKNQEIIQEKGNTPFAIENEDYHNTVLQNGASKEQMVKYNNLASYYNRMFNNDKNIRIKLRDVESLKYIYSIMSEKQHKTAEPFPDFPEAPPTPNPNKPEIIEIVELPEIVELQEDLMLEQEITIEKQQAIAQEEAKKKHIKLQEVVEQKDESVKTGTLEVNGQTLYYTSKIGKTTYYNRWGQKVDLKGNIIETEQSHAEDIIEGQVISKIYKDDKVVAEFNTKNISIPPPTAPPAPAAPTEVPSIRELSKHGAVFYYNGKEISSKKAIKLTDTEKDLNILIKDIDTKKPIVKISKQPISANKD